MEFFVFIFGLLALAAVFGGLISFFSLFSSDSKALLEKRLREIESQLKFLTSHLDTSEKQTPLATTTPEPIFPVPESASLPPQTVSIPLAKAMAGIIVPVNEPEEAPWPESMETIENAKSEQADSRPRFVEPNFIEKGMTAAKNWLFGGNTLVRSGIVILFIGISFLLKYAAEHTHIPIEFRLTAIALAGVGLLAVGWRLRTKRAEYSWAIQGGGVGILYLTIFAALKLYQLIPAGSAFLLLVVVAFLSALLAVLQSAMPLAVLGFSGGFLAPIFTSTGQGSHVNLFSYYLVLNIGIAFIAFYKSWRPLNVLGFAFTFIIATLWGARSYAPEYFATTEPFLVIHFVLFNVIAILYAHKQSTKATDYVDATLVFGTPIVGFSLQYALLRDSSFGLAYSALALGAFYVILAWWILNRRRATLQFLGECYLALGVGFATLALPLALDGRWTSAAWAVEGVALLWAGLRQKRSLPLLAGLVLQLFGAGAFLQGWGLTGYSESGHQNMFLGAGFIALSGLACGVLLNRYRPDIDKLLTALLALWGWLWWMAAGVTAIDEFLPSDLFIHASLLFVALTSLLLPLLGRVLQWPGLTWLSALLLPCMIFAGLTEVSESRPLEQYGWVSWPLAFAIHAWLLRDSVKAGAIVRAPALWLATFIGIMEWQYWLSHFAYEATVWRDIGWAVVPLALLAAIIRWKSPRSDEAAPEHARAWLWWGGAPLIAYLLLWFLKMSIEATGDAKPLAYIPLLNPLDISLSAVLLLSLIWKRSVATPLITRDLAATLDKLTPPVLGLLGFVLLNGMLLRTLHHWAQIPLAWTAIFNYPLVQVSFTLLWSLSALTLMLVAHRRAYRTLWIVGAMLMGLVVLKLFMLDLAGHGSVERIISFIGAGILLLVMGYFAPLPPVANQVEKTKGANA